MDVDRCQTCICCRLQIYDPSYPPPGQSNADAEAGTAYCNSGRHSPAMAVLD